MRKVTLVTGPARSGKSEWAETVAMQSQKAVIYVATATQNSADREWQQRIQKHQQRRPQDWITLEVPVELSTTLTEAKPNTCILIDSLGTWVANLLSQEEESWEKTVQDLLETIELVAVEMIFVAEETGWGVVPAYPIGRTFRDRLSNLVRRLGAISEAVYLVTGGYVLNLSTLGTPLPASGKEDKGIRE
ncbi:bifunctional adenosylcobinamide kinase/adenosylcobinamide-phosphate guanylyltransferase [Chlorogloeopsis sp. ULAP01]|uniref:bifunctional adenosylcobinamide kinase/adenosylcobinamide-phosphate guanylyltransferase n=1 Tax=Chlorogloeopsis sp. ULAP01 TaxID=3056483 RepID=UPI0025AA4F54|nr:bifunctional adenosylcobinamide kinase/adenosylcobinamide-phosphate guanylyltransferase [Chlorogloeopsis sp. ULAP01]MDM9384896.1 bifunctional adenosylcobinamide kinase/adenosylcobinamide-phosphate guanylyltransferase [Chlorogloeopsis sp. ULAP01]